ncbi:MAG: SDR family oxidoreductase [Candidatus Taylorbacteria bacterium]|nr:SDR family oxidoreductase [Candidatus Taylorbacteria bacterium]
MMAKKAANQKQPGVNKRMLRPARTNNPNYRPAGKLTGKVAIITGGDSGIGEAVAITFAKEGADIIVVYLNENEDAENIQKTVESFGRRCYLFSGDVGNEQFCQEVVKKSVERLGAVDILVNNAAEQHVEPEFLDIDRLQIEKTFETNIFGAMFMTQAVLPYLTEGSTIINTSSVTAYKGNERLIDYSATKGALVSFTRSLALALVDRGIRVNAVAPGPVWTPLIDSTFPKAESKNFGKNTPMGRPGEAFEIAPCYVFLASEDSSYITGQVLHPNGGVIVNG